MPRAQCVGGQGERKCIAGAGEMADPKGWWWWGGVSEVRGLNPHHRG